MAEIMARHGLAATFYVPITNIEGRPTLSNTELRDLSSAGFEIGSHTHDHVYLNRCGVDEGRRQILTGRSALQDALGIAAPGFCYPGGHHPSGYAEFLRGEGFSYARTVEGFHLCRSTDLYRLPVTLQLYPHHPLVLIKNCIDTGAGARRLALAARLALTRKMADRLSLLLDNCLEFGGNLHIWGHSWELEKFGGWEVLESFCSRLSESKINSSTVYESIS